jgi:hypothetical protein
MTGTALTLSQDGGKERERERENGEFMIGTYYIRVFLLDCWILKQYIEMLILKIPSVSTRKFKESSKRIGLPPYSFFQEEAVDLFSLQ